MPPLALLLMMAVTVLTATALLALVGASVWPAALLATVLVAALAITLVAWLHGGRRWLSGAALLRAPLYVVWKLPIYLGFLRKRETVWRRTPRAGE